MTKRRLCLLLFALLWALSPGALGAVYSFPYVSVRVDVRDGWTLITPETLNTQAGLLASRGLDPAALQADYAVQGTVCEVWMEDGIRVRLAAQSTAQAELWYAAEAMTEADREDFLATFAEAPYEHAVLSQEAPGAVQCEYQVEVQGTPTAFALLATVEGGRLYLLWATGGDTAALHAANRAVYGAMDFISPSAASFPEDAADAVLIPDPIADDGVSMPITLLSFTGTTTVDTTTLSVKTLPGADLALKTANDTLRVKANEAGEYHYTLSTRRESTYEYTLTASMAGRTASTMDIAIRRQLTDEALQAAYRRSAKTVDAIGYQNLVSNPAAHAGTVLTFRGMAGDFSDVDGFPCVLMFTANPSTGSWINPLWVQLEHAVSIAPEELCTIYGDLYGETHPYTDANGETREVPIVVCRSLEK